MLHGAQVRRTTWVRGAGRFGTARSGLLDAVSDRPLFFKGRCPGMNALYAAFWKNDIIASSAPAFGRPRGIKDPKRPPGRGL